MCHPVYPLLTKLSTPTQKKPAKDSGQGGSNGTLRNGFSWSLTTRRGARVVLLTYRSRRPDPTLPTTPPSCNTDTCAAASIPASYSPARIATRGHTVPGARSWRTAPTGYAARRHASARSRLNTPRMLPRYVPTRSTGAAGSRMAKRSQSVRSVFIPSLPLKSGRLGYVVPLRLVLGRAVRCPTCRLPFERH